MVAEWIAHNEDRQVPENLDHVRDFTLMWSYAEGKIIQHYQEVIPRRRPYDVPSLGCGAFNLVITEDYANTNDHIESAYSFFKRRYIAEGGEIKLRELFNGRDQDYRRTTIATLRENETADLDKIKALSFICSRIRNNLFHGTKNFREIVNEPEVIVNATVGIKGLAIVLAVAHDPE